MDLTRLFLAVLSTTRIAFYSALGVSFTRFDHVDFVDEKICADKEATQTTDLSSDVNCVFLCATQTSCNGVFWTKGASQCVTCSAGFFYENTSTSLSFYKRHAPSASIYLLVKTGLTWSDAKQNCETLGGHLLILNSKEEMDYIYPYLTAAPEVYAIYIGAKGIGGQASTFEWVDGSKVSDGYTNWNDNQPYPSTNKESYILMAKNWDFRWNDVDNKGFSSICEFN